MTEPSTADEKFKPSLSQRFFQGAFWSLVGTIGLRLTTFVGTVIAARILGQVGFGEMGIIQRTIEFAVTFGSLGVGMTTTKYVAELKEQDPLRTGRIIGLTYIVSVISGGVMALGCIVAAPWLAAKTINAPHLSPELRLAGLVFLISAVYRLQNGILTGLQSFKAIARINWLEGICNLLSITILVWLAGLWGVIIAFNLAALLRVILSSLTLTKEYQHYGIRPSFRKAWEEHTVLWQFSLPAFLTSTLSPMVIWAAYAMLANQPGGYAQLGLFNAAMQFQWMITFLNMIMFQVSVPMLAELYAEGQKDKFARSFNLYLKLNWKIAVAGGFLVLGLSPWMIHLFGAQFGGSTQVLGLVIAFTVMMLAWNINGQPFYSGGKMWHNLIIQICWGVILLGAGHWLIPRYGSGGLAISFLLAYSSALVMQFIVIRIIFGKLMVSGIWPVLLLCGLLIGYGFFQHRLPHSYLWILMPIIISFGILIKLLMDHWELIKNLLTTHLRILPQKI